jgi:hypothetical protein
MTSTTSTAANTATETTTNSATDSAAPPPVTTAPVSPQADSSGFYRIQDQKLQFAPNVVHAPGYTLTREGRQQLELPKDGWAWFESGEAAHAHHNLPLPKPEPTGRQRRPEERPEPAGRR